MLTPIKKHVFYKPDIIYFPPISFMNHILFINTPYCAKVNMPYSALQLLHDYFIAFPTICKFQF